MTTTASELDTLVKAAIRRVEEGGIALSDVLDALAPATGTKEITLPKAPPLPIEITEAQEKALAKVADVYGKVVPTERRKLEPVEVTKLVEEKSTLDELKKMAEKRHADIRTIVFNHLDVEAEEQGLVDEKTPREDKTGHYILEGEAHGTPDAEGKFVRTVSNYAPTVSEAALKALADDPEVSDFTHEDYLAMTTQTRVLDENKLMLHLKKRPELVTHLPKAIIPGSKRASLRKAKP